VRLVGLVGVVAGNQLVTRAGVPLDGSGHPAVRLWLVMLGRLLSGDIYALLEGWAKNGRAQTEKPDGSLFCLWRRRCRKGDSCSCDSKQWGLRVLYCVFSRPGD
jgi:hypothetical protein